MPNWWCSSAVEQLAVNQLVGGSNPPTIANAGLAQLVEHLPCKQDVSGSNPLTGTNTTGKSIENRRDCPVWSVSPCKRHTVLFSLWWMRLSARGEMVILILCDDYWLRPRWITSQRTPGSTRHHNNWRVGSMVLKRSWKPSHCASDDGSIPLLSARHSVERFGLLINSIKTPLT